MNEENFIGFSCPSCHTEIEASPDMTGQETECPACGAKLKVPDNHQDDVVRHGLDEASSKADQAKKSRTIRIELGDI